MANTKVPIELSSTPGIVDNSNATAITIDASENVGIGTDSPSRALSVYGAAAGVIAITSNSTDGISSLSFGDTADDNAGRVNYLNASDDMLFYTATAERLRLTSAGNLGLGTGSPRTLINASSATGAILTLESSDTTLTTNGVIGGIDFYSNDSSTNGTGAKVNIRAIAQNSSGTATALTFGTSSSGSATAVEAFRVDASGALILNNTGGDAQIYFGGASGSDRMYLARSGADSLLWNVSNGAMRFGTNNAERMKLDASGNLLVGKTASSAGTVGSELRSTGSILSAMASSSNGSITLGAYSTTANQWQFYVGMAGTPFARSGLGLLSDERRKENIVDLETGLTEVMALRPRRFDWRNRQEGDDTQIAGFIAQEVEAVLPDLISSYADDEIDDLKSVRVGDILPTVVKAMQEQQAIIEALTARLDALEGA